MQEQVELRTFGTQMGKKSLEELRWKAEAVVEEEGEGKRHSNSPIINPNFMSSAFVFWLWPILKLCKKGEIQLEDLPTFKKEEQAAQVEILFDPYWKELKEYWKNPDTKKKPDLLMHLSYILKWRIANVIFWNCLNLSTLLIYPLLLQQMILFIQDSSLPDGLGHAIVVALVLTALIKLLASNIKDVEMRASKQAIQSLLSSAIVRKSIRQSPESKMNDSDGAIINMFNEYIEMVTGVLDVFVGLTSIIYLVLDIFLLYRLIGFAGIIGGIWMFIVTSGFSYIKWIRSAYLGEYAKIAKKKAEHLREFIQGSTVVKYLGDEEQMLEKDASNRSSQVSVLSKFYLNISFSNAIISNNDGILSALVFPIFLLTGGSLTADIAFPALMLMEIGPPIQQINDLFGTFASAKIGAKAIEEFISSPDEETTPACAMSIVPSTKLILNIPRWSFYDGNMKRQEAAVPLSSSKFSLEMPKLEVAEGFTGVAGGVGCGKTTLLKGILGLVPRVSGSVKFHGKFSYAPQKAVLINASVRQNITFYSEFEDRQRLEEVVRCCDLERDLELLSDGLESMVDEQGANLSGGQKARISLARALYRIADVYLLDNPLCGCDAKVSRRIFANLKSFLKDKKVLFVTHNLQHLAQMDSIIYLQDGTVAEHGLTSQLLECKDGMFRKLMESVAKTHFDAEATADDLPLLKSEDSFGSKAGKVQAAKEESEEVTWDTCKSYFSRFSLFSRVLIFTAFLLHIVGFSSSLVFLAAESSSSNSSTSIFMIVYIILSLTPTITSASFYLAYLFSHQRIANRLYELAASSLFNVPISYFHSHSTGIILNRLSNDLSELDKKFVMSWALLFIYTTNLVSITILICLANPYLFILIIGVYLIGRLAFDYLGNTTVKVRRLASLSSSKVLTSLNETLVSKDLLTVFEVENEVLGLFQRRLDENLAARYLLASSEVWFEQRVGICSILIVICTAISGFFVRGNDYQAAIVALALNYALMIGFFAETQLRHLSSAVASMNSYQRLRYYATQLPQETARLLPTDPGREEWPSQGKIEFDELVMSYEGSPEHDVIKQFSATILPGEKVGVVGRTGAGKTTLISALFRMMEAKSGRVVIDGLDISQLGLHTLRKRIAMIPQEAVLFEGTLRSNVGKECSDHQLWCALEQAGMKEYVSSLDGQLDAKVEIEGSNFSHGQRQLLCLARAIVSQPKILIMDEATASIDSAADERIQSLIRSFKDTTVISIAHRLASVSDYDKIMVLSEGRLVEYGPPSRLLLDPHSQYSQLVNASLSHLPPPDSS